MKRTLTIALGAIVLLWCSATARANAPSISESDAAQLFERAAQLCADGKPLPAANLYQQLIESGYPNQAVLYNRGNAALLSGDLGHAVLNYRRAWHISPRDDDTAANLSLALKEAGAMLPQPFRAVGLLRRASLVEWVTLCQMFYWTSAIAAALAFVVKPRRKGFMRIALLLWILTAVSLAGVLAWTGDGLRNEAAAMVDENVRLAPNASALSYSPLPAGSIVRALETSGKWVKISTGNRAGWVPRSSIEPVCEYPPAAMGATSVGM